MIHSHVKTIATLSCSLQSLYCSKNGCSDPDSRTLWRRGFSGVGRWVVILFGLRVESVRTHLHSVLRFRGIRLLSLQMSDSLTVPSCRLGIRDRSGQSAILSLKFDHQSYLQTLSNICGVDRHFLFLLSSHNSHCKPQSYISSWVVL